jgi:hypothetical protein
MCIKIVMPDGATLATVGDAVTRFGGIMVAAEKGYPVGAFRSDGNCLCCVDVDQTARINGYRADWYSDPMEVRFMPGGST